MTKKRILVVDDEWDTLVSIQEILELAGFEVDIVDKGENCIEKAKEKRYDLILIDIYMPDMNGEKVFQILRETINHLTPLVYVTIKPKAEVNLKDVDGFIQKPFENRKLIEQVQMVIESFKQPNQDEKRE